MWMRLGISELNIAINKKLIFIGRPMFCHFILFVSDQQKSTKYYQIVLQLSPTLNVPGMIVFLIVPQTSTSDFY